MARQRDFVREYRQRLSRGLERGSTRAEARGHPRGTPEHPIRAFRNPERYLPYLQRFSRPLRPDEERALAAVNQRRAAAGKAPLFVGQPPEPGAGMRQQTFESLESAENHGRGIPPDLGGLGAGSGGAAIYIWRGGFTLQISRGVRARRRAA